MTPVALHTVFEMLAYAVGFRTFLWTRKRLAPSAFAHEDEVAWVGVGAIVGAALGSKVSYWLDDPLTAFQNFPDVRHLLEGPQADGAHRESSGMQSAGRPASTIPWSPGPRRR